MESVEMATTKQWFWTLESTRFPVSLKSMRPEVQMQSSKLNRNLLVIFDCWSIPRGPEYVEWLGEDVIVHKSWVNGECSHQQNDVTPTKEHGEDLQIKNKYSVFVNVSRFSWRSIFDLFKPYIFSVACNEWKNTSVTKTFLWDKKVHNFTIYLLWNDL